MLRQSSRHKSHRHVAPTSTLIVPPPPAEETVDQSVAASPAPLGERWGAIPEVVLRRSAVLEDDPAWRLTDEGLARPVTTPYGMAGLVFGLPFVLLVLLAFLLR